MRMVIITMFVVALFFPTNFALALSEADYQELLQTSPEFRKTDKELTKNYKSIYDATPDREKEFLKLEQLQWIKSGRDEIANLAIKKGMSKGQAYAYANWRRAMALMGVQSQLAERASKNEKQDTAKAPESPTDAFNAADVVSALESNQLKFEKKFLNNHITIKGNVAKIEQKKENIIVELHGSNDGNPFKTIACQMNPSQEDTVMGLTKGQPVTINGVYKGDKRFEAGVMCSLVLFDCKLQ